MRYSPLPEATPALRAVLLVYTALLVYGSLYPFDWSPLQAPLFSFLHAGLPRHFDKGDLVQNVLVYMPFGLLVAAARGARRQVGGVVLTAMLAGGAVSFAMECTQQWLPSRVASLTDVATNVLGSLVGALLAGLVRRDTLSGARVLAWRDAWFRPGALANVGLATLGLWALSQTSPLVPSLDIAHLRHGLSLLYRQVLGLEPVSIDKVAVALAYLGALGMLLRTLVRPERSALRIFALVLVAVLGCKVLIDGRQLALELVLGAAGAWLLLALERSVSLRVAAATGIVLLAAGMVVYELTPAPYAGLQQGFNWIPFLGQMNGLNGFENILELLWPPMAMACLARGATPLYRHDALAVAGGLAVLLLLFALEWMQLSVPGRSADITQVLLGGAGWIVPWCVREPARRPVPRR